MHAYQFQLDEKGFRVEVDIAADLPPTLADRDGAAQALINLLNNAVKYSTGRKELVVTAASGAGGIHLTVTDRGVGIPKEEQRRIFEGFYRAKAAIDLGRRGSGLGLSLVQHIMHSHGGRIELKSSPGEGSSFVLVFPLRTAQDRELIDTDAQAGV
jgi:two-component system phosphate regulon sensor histidine kinase PhoR